MTPGIGASAHTLPATVAPILEKDVGTIVRVVPEAMDMLRISRFEEREFDIGVIGMTDMYSTMMGYGGSLAFPLGQRRALWNFSDTPWGVIVRGDSPLKTIYDIKANKGVKVIVMVAAPGMVGMKDALLAFLGITEEDVELVPLSSYAASVSAISEGKGDVAFASPISSVTQEIESTPRGIRWLDMPLEDKEGWLRWLSVIGTHIPAEMDQGVKSAQGHVGFMANYLFWTLADQDQELTYQLSKWFNEKFDLYKDAHVGCLRMSIEYFRSFMDCSCFPISEGTIRYFKEIGQWTTDDDKWNAEAVDLMTKYVEARAATLAEARTRGIKIDVENEEFLNLWARHQKDLPSIHVRLK